MKKSKITKRKIKKSTKRHKRNRPQDDFGTPELSDMLNQRGGYRK